MRIALCLSGHARTYDLTHKFWKKNLMAYHETDVFMHLWDTIGPRWFGENRVESLNPAPRPDFHSGIIASPIIDINQIRDIWEPLNIVVEQYEPLHQVFARDVQPVLQERDKRGIPAGFEHHHPLSVRSMLYKRILCNRLKMDREVLLGGRYDLVIQCRPDVALTQPLAEDVIGGSGPIYFHNSRSVTKEPEICDFGSIGTSEQVDFYCELFNNLQEELQSVGDDFFQFLNPHKMYVNYFKHHNTAYIEKDLGLCILRENGIILGWPHAANIVKTFKED